MRLKERKQREYYGRVPLRKGVNETSPVTVLLERVQVKLFAFAGPIEVNRECRKAYPHGHSISL